MCIENQSMKVSTITVCRNSFTSIVSTMESIFCQTFPLVERIVIDGASTDGTANYLESQRERINVLVSEPDGGIYDAMNKGIRASSGDYLIFMNAGDRFATDDVIERVMNHQNVISRRPKLISGRVQLEYSAKLTNLFRPSRPGKEGEGLPHQGTFIEGDLQRNHLFDTRFGFVSDYELWRRLKHKGLFDVLYLEEVIAVFSLGGRSNSIKSDPQRYLERAYVDYQYSGRFRSQDWMRFLLLILARKFMHTVLGERLFFSALRFLKTV